MLALFFAEVLPSNYATRPEVQPHSTPLCDRSPGPDLELPRLSEALLGDTWPSCLQSVVPEALCSFVETPRVRSGLGPSDHPTLQTRRGVRVFRTLQLSSLPVLSHAMLLVQGGRTWSGTVPFTDQQPSRELRVKGLPGSVISERITFWKLCQKLS
jgi:hypothetical protein